ncbi:MAG TPA: Fic family protein, partial [Acidimicrobiales bacterium]
TTDALASGNHHPLIVVSACILDLLCIHPFDDGNGRVARLLTAWLLITSGYGVGRYVSIEQLVYESRSEYYRSLSASTDGWFDNGQHSIWPWTTFLLERLATAYERFEARILEVSGSGSKQERARRHILDHAASTFTIADLRRALPGTSDATIRVVLTELRDSGHIEREGSGRGAVWRRTRRS